MLTQTVRRLAALTATAALAATTGVAFSERSSAAAPTTTATTATTATAAAGRTATRVVKARQAAAARDDKVEVVAVGDIACPADRRPTRTTCHQAETARLTRKLDPEAVLLLGDNQYETGSLYDYRHSYDRSWGQFKRITYPVPGNHEYRAHEAAGYYRYFRGRQPGRPGYYAVNLRSGAAKWRLYALNSACGHIDCDRQYRWLRDDLNAHPRDCSLFTMHHPRYSSGGEHGSDGSLKPFYRIADHHGVEMILAGHDHNYERFARMDAERHRRRDGVIQFISGAGGRSHYHFGKVRNGSDFRLARHFGVLRLVLRDDRFRFAFKDVNGSTPDHGNRSCR